MRENRYPAKVLHPYHCQILAPINVSPNTLLTLSHKDFESCATKSTSPSQRAGLSHTTLKNRKTTNSVLFNPPFRSFSFCCFHSGSNHSSHRFDLFALLGISSVSPGAHVKRDGEDCSAHTHHQDEIAFRQRKQVSVRAADGKRW